MNPEAHNILRQMQGSSKNYESSRDPVSAINTNTFQLFQMARIQVLVAEEQERSANKLECLTRKLIFLTWGLIILTVFILIFTIVLVKLH